VKIRNHILAIILCSVYVNPACWVEGSEDRPTLHDILDQVGGPVPVTPKAMPSEGRDSDASAVIQRSNGTEDNEIGDKSKLDGQACQTQPSKALQGGVIQTELNEEQNRLSGQADKEIAAIGISWNLFTRVITYVDPGSDLFGKVEPGKDRFLGLGHLDANEVVRTGYNIGDSGTWVDAVIRAHDHSVRHIPVRRRPVSTFAAKFARSFARQYKLRH
jgi:hypothetical protein